MNLRDRVVAFEQLGSILSNIKKTKSFNDVIKNVQINNPWFVQSNVIYSGLALSKMLNPTSLNKFVNSYCISNKKKKIGVIVPSNIPFVGFYDFLCVLLSGNIFIGKLSSSNNVLLPYLANILFELNNGFKDLIFFKKKLENIDMIIATGTDTSFFRFNYTYSYLPNIIRKNRTSIAVLNGLETDDDFLNLAFDVYLYFGLGCRSISKLFLPRSFDIQVLRKYFKKISLQFQNTNYMANYNYQKSLLIINAVAFYDFNNLLLVESIDTSSPISVLFYDYYDSIEEMNKIIDLKKDQIQCVVSQDLNINHASPFGSAQTPTLYDFPDRLDVMKFMNST